MGRILCFFTAYRRGALALFFAATAVDAEASAWGAQPGQWLVILRGDYFQAELSAPENGAPDAYERREANVYAEVGLVRNLTVGGRLAYGSTWRTRGAAIEQAHGFSEVSGFAQYRIGGGGNSVFSVRSTLSVPSTLQSGARPALASEGVDAEFSALGGWTVRAAAPKVFAAGEAGYRKRFDAAADQVRLYSAVGLESGARWLFLLESFATVSMRNEVAGGADYDVLKIQPSIVYRASRRWSLQSGVTQEAAARNLSPGRTLFVGVWARF